MWMFLAEAGKIYLFNKFIDAPRLFAPVASQAKTDILRHRQMREKRKVLKHQTDRPRLGRHMHAGPLDQSAIDPHFTFDTFVVGKPNEFAYAAARNISEQDMPLPERNPLYIFGGEVIRGFTIIMIWGVVIGTYSTIYIATPILYYLNLRTAGEKAQAEGEGRQ